MRNNKWVFIILAVLTLGLAPYTPEPHLFGKLRWLMGGGEGMQTLDYFDLLLHAAPWIILVISLIQLTIRKVKSK